MRNDLPKLPYLHTWSPLVAVLEEAMKPLEVEACWRMYTTTEDFECRTLSSKLLSLLPA